MANIIQNPFDDEEDDSIALELVTPKEALQAATTFHNILLHVQEDNAPPLLYNEKI